MLYSISPPMLRVYCHGEHHLDRQDQPLPAGAWKKSSITQYVVFNPIIIWNQDSHILFRAFHHEHRYSETVGLLALKRPVSPTLFTHLKYFPDYKDSVKLWPIKNKGAGIWAGEYCWGAIKPALWCWFAPADHSVHFFLPCPDTLMN